MADAFRIEVKNLSESERRLARVAAGLLDLRPFWPLVVPLFIGWMRQQFATEGAWAGRRWARLSPGYLAYKSRAYPGKGILVASGDLRMAASKPSRSTTATSLTLTIDDPKLGFHQKGNANLPKRPLLFDRLPAVGQVELQRAAADYAADIAKRA